MSSNTKFYYSPQLALQKFQSSSGSICLGETTLREITSSTGSVQPSLGSKVTFKVKPYGNELLRNCWIKVTFSPVAQTGGTFARLCNGIAINLWDRMSIRSGGQIISQVEPQTAFPLFRKIVKSEIWDNLSAMVGIQSVADRNAAANGEQTVYLPLSYFYSYFANGSTPIALLNHEDLMVEFDLKTVGNIVETDGTAPTVSISDMRMIAEYTHNSTIEKYVFDIYNKNETLQRMYGLKTGWLLNNFDYVHIPSSVASGATKAQVPLPDLNNKDVISILVTLRLDSEIAANNLDNYQQIASVDLKSGNTHLNGAEDPLSYDFLNKVALTNENYNGAKQALGSNIFSIVYSENIGKQFENDDARSFYGSKSFSNVNDAILYVTFGSPLGGIATLDVSIISAERQLFRNGRIETLETQIRR